MTLALFIALQVADIATTLHALKIGKREVNPILRRLFEYFTPAKVLLVFKAAGIVAIWAVNLPWLTAAACVVYAVVVASNLRVVLRK